MNKEELMQSLRAALDDMRRRITEIEAAQEGLAAQQQVLYQEQYDLERQITGQEAIIAFLARLPAITE